MPWASEAQRRYFHANPKLRKYIPEFDAATPKGAKLPYKAGRQEKPMSNFNRLAQKLAERPGVSNPRALVASIGRKKYGEPTMAKASARGVSAASIAKKRY